jgi:hypothetical protein
VDPLLLQCLTGLLTVIKCRPKVEKYCDVTRDCTECYAHDSDDFLTRQLLNRRQSV